MTLVGRYKNHSDNCTIRLTGKMGSRDQTFTFAERSFPSEKTGSEFLPRLWATRRVGHLLEQIRLNGEHRELVDEIVALGTRYGIVTPYTSYLVTDDIKVAGRRAMPREVTAMAPGVAGGTGPGKDLYDKLGSTGAAGVARSKAEKSLSESESVNLPDQYLSKTKTAVGKTFQLKDAVWVDTEYKDDSTLPRVELKFGSDEFFAVLTKEPKLADFFALGEKVIVVFGGKVYRVT